MDGTTRNLVGIPINQPGFHGKEIVWCFPLLNYWTLPSPTLTQEVKEVPFAELSQGEDYIRVKVWPLSPWTNGGAWGMGFRDGCGEDLVPLGEVYLPTLHPQNGRDNEPPKWPNALQAEKTIGMNHSSIIHYLPRHQARKSSKTLNCSFNSNQSNHLSNEKHPGCLGCIGSYTTLCCRVYYIQLLESLLNSQYKQYSKGFFSLLTWAC